VLYEATKHILVLFSSFSLSLYSFFPFFQKIIKSSYSGDPPAVFSGQKICGWQSTSSIMRMLHHYATMFYLALSPHARLVKSIVFTAAWRGAATHHLHTFTASMARGVATLYTHRRGEYIHYSLGY